jgi:hypothetical protein
MSVKFYVRADPDGEKLILRKDHSRNFSTDIELDLEELQYIITNGYNYYELLSDEDRDMEAEFTQR